MAALITPTHQPHSMHHHTGLLTAPAGDATTTLYPSATRNGRHPIGTLTSTAATFINTGTTTEYMTQHVGTYLDDKYAKVESTSTREYFRIRNTNDAAINNNNNKPIKDRTYYEVNGRLTTQYTVRHSQTHIDGHLAQLVSKHSKVFSDPPPFISATPVYDPNGDLNIKPDKPKAIRTETVGYRKRPLKLEEIIEKEKNHHDGNPNKIKARSINTQPIVQDQDGEKIESIPTFTVAGDGELNIPSVEAVQALENEIEPTTAHRFDRPIKPTKAIQDTVTYIGFVDFTTTIDDTVVIFRPKKTLRTQSRNILLPKIEPTRLPERHRTSPPDNNQPEVVPTLTSGINPLKSLLAASASRRNLFSKTASPAAASTVVNNRPRVTLKPNLLGNNNRPNNRLIGTKKAPEPNDLSSSIEGNSDVELVFKTLYTTYTYFTTFFRASTTRVKSREEIISNVVTLTNILEASDLASLRKSCEIDSTCIFASSSERPAAVNGFIGRPNTKEAVINEEPEENDEGLNGLLRTFYTTYTYFTTLFVDGESSISTRTEVYSNVKSSGVPEKITLTTRASLAVAGGSGSPSPRRLEYSSLDRDVQLQSELDDVEDEEEEKSSTTESSFIVVGATTQAEVTEAPSLDIQPTTSSTYEEVVTEETPEELLEVNDIEAAESVTEKRIVENDIVKPSPVMKTFFTTFTYFTTLFRNGTSYITSNLETETNTAEATIVPTVVQPSVTFFTTFTYWTTSIDGDNTIITSSEETKTDVLPASVTEGLVIEAAPATQEPIRFTPTATLGQLVEPTASPPELDSSAEKVEAGKSSSTTPSLESSSSAAFEDLDDEFTLTKSSSSEAKRSRFTRPSRTFTPVIRPQLLRTRARPNPLRARDRTRTTVAIITRSDVTPTLIATPASVLPSPSIESSTKLNSASILNRGKSRFSSSARGVNVSPSSSGVHSDISPSSTVQADLSKPSIVPNLRLRRPNPFRARLRERQRLQLKKLREKSQEDQEKDEKKVVSLTKVNVPKFPSVPGGNTPIFVSSRTENINRKPKVAAVNNNNNDDGPKTRERARQRLINLFRRRRPAISKPKPSEDESDLAVEESRRRQSPVVNQNQRRQRRQVGIFHNKLN